MHGASVTNNKRLIDYINGTAAMHGGSTNKKWPVTHQPFSIFPEGIPSEQFLIS
ncbi:MAG: hypothetical protein LH473_03055 [Chitinophagales bacterium]|nr:hypothetical protein [Chitinophagales bacterium]